MLTTENVRCDKCGQMATVHLDRMSTEPDLLLSRKADVFFDSRTQVIDCPKCGPRTQQRVVSCQDFQ
jgi:ribosomal protein S27AE